MVGDVNFGGGAQSVETKTPARRLESRRALNRCSFSWLVSRVRLAAARSRMALKRCSLSLELFVGRFDSCSFALSCEAFFPLLAEFVGPKSDLMCHPSGIHECSSSEIVRNAVIWAGFQCPYLPLQIVHSSCRQWTPDGRNLNNVIALVFGHWTIGLIPEFLLVDRVDFKDIPHGPAVPSKPPHHPLNEELVWSEFTLRGYFMIVPPIPESIEGGVQAREGLSLTRKLNSLGNVRHLFLPVCSH